MAPTYAVNSFWADKAYYDDAERRYYENLAKGAAVAPQQVVTEPKKSKKSKNKGANAVAAVQVPQETPPPAAQQPQAPSTQGKKKNKNKNAGNAVGAQPQGGGGGEQAKPKTTLASEVAKTREYITKCLESHDSLLAEEEKGRKVKGGTASVGKSGCSGGQCEAPALSKKLDAVQQLCKELEKRVAALELKCQTCAPAPASSSAQKKAAPAKPPAKADDDDDVDLFGSESEEEDDTAKKVKEQRLAEYAAKKSKKPTLIAKSSIVLDVKPWDDETDMAELEKEVRKIEMDGLLWGASKLVPLAYGIKKLSISTVVEDDKVSVDLLTEQIESLSELVQSVDIAAFNKI